MKQVYVEIVKRAMTLVDKEEVIKRLGPMSKTKGEKVERGALINLNTEDYFVRMVDV